jgi:hypothetical protein
MEDMRPKSSYSLPSLEGTKRASSGVRLIGFYNENQMSCWWNLIFRQTCSFGALKFLTKIKAPYEEQNVVILVGKTFKKTCVLQRCGTGTVETVTF